MALLALGLLSGCGSNAFQDKDGDGYSDQEEIEAGTDPQNPASTPPPATPPPATPNFAITSVNTSVEECNPVPQNTITTANATGAVTYAITGGVDATDFSIDATTGVVDYNGSTPDYEKKNSYVYEVTATDSGSGDTDVKTVTLTITNFQTTKNGFDYGCVTNDTTGEVWLDRNLGAAHICTNMTDVACFGDYYQWGRGFDGHQDSTSGTVAILSPVEIAQHGSFITYGSDWVSVDAVGLIRPSIWSASDGSSICPVGYRVPNEAELEAERNSWSSNNAAGAISGTVVWPASGYRRRDTGNLARLGDRGYCWSYIPNATNSQALRFDAANGFVLAVQRAHGLPVRCIKN